MCVILHMSVVIQDGYSPVMLAAMKGETEVVVELVKAGANVDMQNEVRTYVNTFVVHNVHTLVDYTLQWYTLFCTHLTFYLLATRCYRG